MRRKIALGITAFMTLLLLVLRAGWIPALTAMSIGPFDVAHLIPFVLVLVTVTLAVLCFRKGSSPCEPPPRWKAPCGWFSTFAGAVLTLTTLYNVICLAVFGEIPPPNTEILNQIDNIAMLLMLLFGIVGGVFLVILGFNWMADIQTAQPYLPWVSVAPALWMWFRLARYEISYASTVDISENVYAFSTMIFVSLFLLQIARATMHIGKTPKNSLLLFSLCTAMVTISGIPGEFMQIPQNASLSTLLVAVVDMVIGLFATMYAVMLVFCETDTENAAVREATPAVPSTPIDEWVDCDADNGEANDTVTEEQDVEADPATEDDSHENVAEAWDEPVVPSAPLSPPFDPDNRLPEETVSDSKPSVSTNQDIDDILAQIESDFN